MGDTESCSSTATESASTKRRMRRQKFDVYEDICQRLRASENEEASQPGFEDELWNHFNRFSSSYATAVYVEQPEDVIMHMKLLDRAVDPTTRPAFELRIVQVPVTDVSCGETVHSTRNVDPQTSDGSTTQKQDYNRPTYAFGLSPSLEVTEANNSNGQGGGDGDGDGEPHFFRRFFEITISTVDKPKLLSQLTSVLSDIGLNIQEAHAFSTTDGYSLDIFVVDGWSSEETEGLKDILQREIPKIENQFRLKHQFKSPAKVLCQTESELSHEYVKIPTDEGDVWELDPVLLKFDHLIATGSCKELYKGTYGSQDVAIKVLRGEYLNADVKREFGQEVFILRKVRHKNVVQFIGACTRPPSLCIVTEFMSRGSVFDYLHKQKGIFKLPAMLKVAIDVSKGMNYLHHNKIVHRDLKAANLLMDENDVVKVADFGVAKVQTPTGVMTAETGTYRWMAPEVIEHKPYDGKADVFSFGIVLWELLTGKVPYEQLTPLQAAVGVVQKGLRPLVPPNTHPKMAALLERCWQQNPSSRPDFSEITEMLHQILNEVTKERKAVHSPKKKEEKIVTRIPFLGGSSKHTDRCAVKKQESADG
ncbi:serine/threonine-protein kinase STY46-like isoform X2 [Rhododendron vialii]|uniref:serine/threonine-protein kinase STY46-like isoform X2 n=1 Tax=Rhododendron vialii TaxID=182163 RepID=UPI00265F7639|nr:serine/threonine-protein kinase STY46-like isoform X2 [Rhododendron vialii]